MSARPPVEIPTLAAGDVSSAIASLESAAAAALPAPSPAPGAPAADGTPGGAAAKRGRGRPKGSTTKNRTKPAGKLTADADAAAQLRQLTPELEQLRARNAELEASAAGADAARVAEQSEAVEDLVKEAADAIANLAAAAWGPHMKLEEDQKNRLGTLGARVARLYAPQIAEDSPVWALGLAAVSIVGSKVALHRQLVVMAKGDQQRFRELAAEVSKDD